VLLRLLDDICKGGRAKLKGDIEEFGSSLLGIISDDCAYYQ